MQALWRNVLITGASSGLGRALAEACAAPGVVLHLSGRDAGRLEEAASACRARGAEVLPRVMDVCDADAMAAWITGAGRLDLVIANAGISAGTLTTHPEDLAAFEKILRVNVVGLVATFTPFAAAMCARGAGSLVGIASVAGIRGLPGSGGYCASKAAAIEIGRAHV